MPDNSAAFWSAVAASFAALTAFLTMLIARRNLLESARPELVLNGWDRRLEGQGDTTRDVIRFETIRNVGRGAAFNIILNATNQVENRPTAVMSTTTIPILASNETYTADGQIILWWKNVPSEVPGKHLFINVVAYCWDARGYRHVTKHQLVVVELSQTVSVSDGVAPGVSLYRRTVTTRPVWILKACRALARIPLLGKQFRSKDV